MSVVLDGNNDYLINTGTPPVTAVPLTISAWYKGNETGQSDCIVSLCQSGVDTNAFSLLRSSGDAALARVRDGSVSSNATSTNTASDTNWHHYCARFVDNSNRYSYLDGDTANRGASESTARTPTASSQMVVGVDGALAFDSYGYIAHVAIWNVALSEANIVLLAGGTNPLNVDSGNLVFYAPLLVDESPMQDVVGSYDLTLTNQAAYSSENPSVNPAATRYLKMLVHPSAIGQIITEGIVLAESTSSPLTIVGDKIGEFVGGSPQYTFVDGSSLSPATDAGYAVLKVPVADFGGSALTTSNTPFAVARNASYTTGLVACTVIDE